MSDGFFQNLTTSKGGGLFFHYAIRSSSIAKSIVKQLSLHWSPLFW